MSNVPLHRVAAARRENTFCSPIIGGWGACLLLLLGGMTRAQTDAPAAVTVYNQNFAVVRQTLPLELKKGINHVTVSDITAHVEPDSVILRDPSGKRVLSVREQNYRADPLTQELLLSLFEGQTVPFQTVQDGKTVTVQGKIVRSGYVPHSSAFGTYGQNYYYQQQTYAQSEQPIIEVNGHVQFGLPGQPLFPSLPGDTILKPTLDWTLDTDKSGPVSAELAYVTGGMTWSASYNLVAPTVDNGTMDLVGWVTIDNQSGRTFPDAHLKLMAGDVSKLQPNNGQISLTFGAFAARDNSASAPAVTEKTFDEYHLYTLARPTTLRDRETKQVEFVRAPGIHYKQIYTYDGAKIDDQYQNYSYYDIRNSQNYGAKFVSTVSVTREFVNSEVNHLGIPLPKGRLRFYRQDADGQLEFTGENAINHTPKDETVRVITGNAFDLTGERVQTNYKIDTNRQIIDETFSIKVRNHKKEAATVRVVEHLYRGLNWTLPAHSLPYVKKNSQAVEFTLTIPPNGEQAVTYTAHYTW